MVRKDGSSDASTQAVNARMHNFCRSQAANLSERQINPDSNSLVGRLAGSRATGWALKAMGFDLRNEAQTQPIVGATLSGATPQGSSRQTGACGGDLRRQDSPGRRGGFLGFGSNRGGRNSPAPGMSSGASPRGGGRVLTKRSDSFLTRAKRTLGGGSSHRGAAPAPGEVLQKL